MEGQLSGTRDGISERFAPEQDPGRLIEVEHFCRYRWAAQAATGRSVLDAGCGTAYGTRLLGEGGATSVLGVDIASAVLDSVAPSMPANVTLREGDLRALEDEGGTFDLVVCFEVIEHLDDPFPVLDELVRVLAPGGVLLVSSPNRDVYEPGNPHHLHEFTPEELRDALSERLANVRLLRQSSYIASALLDDDALTTGGGDALDDIELRKLIATRPGEETYTVGIASQGQLPELRELALMTGTLEMREWLSVFDTQTEAISDKDAHIAQLTERIGETEELQRMLLESEQRAASIPELQQRIADLEHALGAAQSAVDSAHAERRKLDERLMHSEQVLVDVLNSPSWQATEPLRRLKRRLR